MNQTHELLNALKKVLRAQGITYAQAAKHLELSEASVKRLFSEHSFSILRLEQLCDLVGLTLYELANQARHKTGAISELSPQQEEELVADHGLLLVTMLALNGWPMAEILTSFTFTEPQVIRHLALLDRMKMIELLPGNTVRRLVARNFSWRKDGPVQRFFEQYIRTEFFDSRFARPGEHMRLANGMLSRDAIHRLHGKMDQLVEELDAAVQADADLPLSERFGTSMVLAIRPWELSVFTRFRQARMKSF